MKAACLLPARTALVVLGMHRSGTSSIAGAFSLLGGTPPRTLMPAAEDNPRGFWESAVLMEYHDRLLKAGGGSWRDWRTFPLPGVLAEHPEFLEEGRRLLESEFGDSALIVLKDPRICRFFPLWETLLSEVGYRTVVVFPLRSPVEVAASLTSRNDMNEVEALRLWLRHVLDAERASRGYPRVFLRWTDFLSDWRKAVSTVSQALDLAIEANDVARSVMVDEFLSGDLRRQVVCPSNGMVWVSDAYAVFDAFVQECEHETGRNRLDEIRWMFDASCELFADAAR